MGEDAFAYPNYVAGTFFNNSLNNWTRVQEREAFAGTQGTWSMPRTINYDKYYPSAEWNADPYHIAKVSQWIGIIALTAASYRMKTRNNAGHAEPETTPERQIMTPGRTKRSSKTKEATT